MGDGGFSKRRLDRLRAVLAGHVEAGTAPGLVALVSRGDEMHVEAMGSMAVGSSAPMQRDTIFRITSMTKPVIAAATMLLVEECAIRLDEPVDRLLPELANRRVLTRLDAPLDDTVPARRPITVRDLLTFRMGFGMLLGSPDEFPILRAVDDLGVGSVGMPYPIAHEPDEWIRRLGTLPLMDQPGDTWRYNSGAYVLGVLIARAAGQPLDRFLQERIFEPLGMRDTGFWVRPDQLHRLPTAYLVDDAGGLQLLDEPGGQWSAPPVFADGGAGLVSTVDDYLAFARMLLRDGAHGGERLLSRPSVALMTADHLTPAQKASSGFLPDYWQHRGWGFGMAVVTGRDELWASPGRYGWDGGFGTSWANDPAEDVVGLLMTQASIFPLFSPLYHAFWTSAYQALDD